MDENSGNPTPPRIRYPAMAAKHSFGASASNANTITNVCSVNGTGPNGTDTHADTLMSAIVNPTNATERVRDAVPAPFAPAPLVPLSLSRAVVDASASVIAAGFSPICASFPQDPSKQPCSIGKLAGSRNLRASNRVTIGVTNVAGCGLGRGRRRGYCRVREMIKRNKPFGSVTVSPSPATPPSRHRTLA